MPLQFTDFDPPIHTLIAHHSDLITPLYIALTGHPVLYNAYAPFFANTLHGMCEYYTTISKAFRSGPCLVERERQRNVNEMIEKTVSTVVALGGPRLVEQVVAGAWAGLGVQGVHERSAVLLALVLRTAVLEGREDLVEIMVGLVRDAAMRMQREYGLGSCAAWAVGVVGCLGKSVYYDGRLEAEGGQEWRLTKALSLEEVEREKGKRWRILRLLVENGLRGHEMYEGAFPLGLARDLRVEAGLSNKEWANDGESYRRRGATRWFEYPLTAACYYKDAELAKFLIENGAKLDQDQPLDYLAMEKSISASTIFRKEMVPSDISAPITAQSADEDGTKSDVPRGVKFFTSRVLSLLEFLHTQRPHYQSSRDYIEDMDDWEEDIDGIEQKDEEWRNPWGGLLGSFMYVRYSPRELNPPNPQLSNPRNWHLTCPVQLDPRFPPSTQHEVPYAWKRYYVKEIAAWLLEKDVPVGRAPFFDPEEEAMSDDVMRVTVEYLGPFLKGSGRLADYQEEEAGGGSLRLWLMREFFKRGKVDANDGWKYRGMPIQSITNELLTAVLTPEALELQRKGGLDLSSDACDPEKIGRAEKSEAWKVMELLIENGAETSHQDRTTFKKGWNNSNVSVEASPLELAEMAGWGVLVEVLKRGYGVRDLRKQIRLCQRGREYDAEESDEEE